MTADKRRNLVSALIKAVDYDIWKGMFESPEEPELNDALLDQLDAIVVSAVKSS